MSAPHEVRAGKGDVRPALGFAQQSDGLARAVRRGLDNMRIQAFLTAAAVNLKRLAAALLTAVIALFALLSTSWNAALGLIAAMAASPGTVRPVHAARC